MSLDCSQLFVPAVFLAVEKLRAIQATTAEFAGYSVKLCRIFYGTSYCISFVKRFYSKRKQSVAPLCQPKSQIQFVSVEPMNPSKHLGFFEPVL